MARKHGFFRPHVAGLSGIYSTTLREGVGGLLASINAWKNRNGVIAIGDSVTIAGETASLRPEGWWAFSSFLSLGQVYHQGNVGVSGQTTAQMLARFAADVVARSPAFVTILGGTNDIPYVPGTLSIAQITANIEDMIQAAQAAGIGVIVGTTTPQATSSYAYSPNVAALNAAIEGLCTTYGATLADFHSAVANPDGTWISGYNADEVHPGAAGKKAMAQAWVTATSALFAGQSWLPTETAVPNDLVQYGLMSDAGSTWAGVPLGFNYTAPSSGSAVYSIVADAGVEGNWARAVFTSAVNARVVAHNFYNVKVGDVLAVAARVRSPDAESGGLTYTLKCAFVGNGTSVDPISAWTRDVDGTVYFELTVPSGTTYLQCYFLANGSGTLDVAQFGILNLTALAAGTVRSNVVAKSEPLLADLTVKSTNVTQASFSENGLTNGVQFPSGFALEFAYTGAGVFQNTQYRMSCYAIADDGNPMTTADVKFRLNATTVVPASVQQVSGSLYRVISPVITVGATTDATAWGLIRDGSCSGRAFRASGFQVDMGTAVLAYEKTPRA